MTQYRRKPAVVALVVSFAAGLTLLAATGQFRAAANSGDALETFERAIAGGKNDAGTWAKYGAALQLHHRYAHAAGAYERALELSPNFQQVAELRFNAAMCLAQSGDADKFFAYFAHLTAADPKQAVDLLEREEVASMRGDARWNAATATARSQAAD